MSNGGCCHPTTFPTTPCVLLQRPTLKASFIEHAERMKSSFYLVGAILLASLPAAIVAADEANAKTTTSGQVLTKEFIKAVKESSPDHHASHHVKDKKKVDKTASPFYKGIKVQSEDEAESEAQAAEIRKINALSPEERDKFFFDLMQAKIKKREEKESQELKQGSLSHATTAAGQVAAKENVGAAEPASGVVSALRRKPTAEPTLSHAPTRKPTTHYGVQWYMKYAYSSGVSCSTVCADADIDMDCMEGQFPTTLEEFAEIWAQAKDSWGYAMDDYSSYNIDNDDHKNYAYGNLRFQISECDFIDSTTSSATRDDYYGGSGTSDFNLPQIQWRATINSGWQLYCYVGDGTGTCSSASATHGYAYPFCPCINKPTAAPTPAPSAKPTTFSPSPKPTPKPSTSSTVRWVFGTTSGTTCNAICSSYGTTCMEGHWPSTLKEFLEIYDQSFFDLSNTDLADYLGSPDTVCQDIFYDDGDIHTGISQGTFSTPVIYYTSNSKACYYGKGRNDDDDTALCAVTATSTADYYPLCPCGQFPTAAPTRRRNRPTNTRKLAETTTSSESAAASSLRGAAATSE